MRSCRRRLRCRWGRRLPSHPDILPPRELTPAAGDGPALQRPGAAGGSDSPARPAARARRPQPRCTAAAAARRPPPTTCSAPTAGKCCGRYGAARLRAAGRAPGAGLRPRGVASGGRVWTEAGFRPRYRVARRVGEGVPRRRRTPEQPPTGSRDPAAVPTPTAPFLRIPPLPPGLGRVEAS